ncbi:MAG TPA: flagellar biosynthetic protein FliO [Rhodocyclaceae bacterium]|nr:flagellar biosynthetic protein FliO [Rhodocyclaceae bacterium]
MVPAVPNRFPIALAPLLPGLAHAQTAPSQDLGGSIFQLLFGLLVVIVVLIASLWLLKRLSAPRGEAAGLMRVVAGTAVGARERVVILEVGTTWLVLGVAPGRVTALAEMPRGNLPAAPTPSQSKDFAGRLRQMLDRPHAS